MAKYFGTKSRYLSKNILMYCLVAASYISIIFYIVYKAVLSIGKKPSVDNLIAILIVFGPLLLFAYIKYKEADSISELFSRGRKGEWKIEDELKKLPDEYSVFSDVKIKYGNIDFVVIGPKGVYAIEVKSHSGVIDLVDGKLVKNNKPLEKDFLKQAKREAFDLNEYLKLKLGVNIFVNPVVVFANYSKMKFGLNPVEGVSVVSQIWLNKLIQDHPDYYFPVDRTKIEHELGNLVKIR